jgi:hypothetical protein
VLYKSTLCKYSFGWFFLAGFFACGLGFGSSRQLWFCGLIRGAVGMCQKKRWEAKSMTEKTTEGHGNVREGQQAQGEFGKIPLKIINSFYQTAGLAALWVRVSKAASLFSFTG